jgi:hypothetical protein
MIEAHARNKIWNFVLAIVLLVLVIRLGFCLVEFGEKSLQMDFSAFYAAGQSVGEGLSPYVNHVDHSPPIWDGVNTFRHSRFLYPPLVSRVFQPFTLLSYHSAKYVWMLLGLAALGGALWLAARIAGIERKPRQLLIIGIIAAAFFPLMTLLERGQIDSITLLLLMAAIASMSTQRAPFATGVFLALAALLKLHCIFLVPFVLLRRQWRVLGGVVAGGVVLLLLSLAIDGPGRVSGYLTEELPRISRYGERGSREMRLPVETAGPLVETVRSGRSVMDGRQYDLESFRFVLNASAVRTPLGRAIWSALRGIGLDVAPAQISFVFLAVCMLGLVAWQRWNGMPAGPDREAWELVYWQVVLVVILLCAPATWAMGTVWLLPIGVIVVREFPRAKSRTHVISLTGCALGLLIAGLPDLYDRAIGWPINDRALDFKYVVAELLCLAGLLSLWRVYHVQRDQK